MNNNKIEEAVEVMYQEVKRLNGQVLFDELEDVVEGIIPVKGEYCFSHPDNENYIFWVNVSQEFIMALMDLANKPDISMRETFLYNYASAKKFPNLRPTQTIKSDEARKNPKKPIWVPMAFYLK